MYSALAKIFSAFFDTLAWCVITALIVAVILSGVEILSAGGWRVAQVVLRAVQP